MRKPSYIPQQLPAVNNSKYRTAICTFFGGMVLVSLGITLVMTAILVRHPYSDDTSILISGPTCLTLGLVVLALSGSEMIRHKKMNLTIESEVSRVLSSVSSSKTNPQWCQGYSANYNPNVNNVSIVVNKTTWPS